MSLALVLVVALAACDQQRAPSVCDAIQKGPELAGATVTIHAWHGSAGFWDALGSDQCDKLILPDFDGPFEVNVEGPSDPQTAQLVAILQKKPVIIVPFDFEAEFTGVLEERNGYHPTGPVPLDAPPATNEMPYVLRVTGIDRLKIDRARWKEAEPPPPEQR